MTEFEDFKTVFEKLKIDNIVKEVTVEVGEDRVETMCYTIIVKGNADEETYLMFNGKTGALEKII